MNLAGTNHLAARIALGTVQFGMPYGIANHGTQVTRSEAARMIHRLSECGVDTIDTAIGYGESEAVLGSIGVKNFKVISKLPKLPCEIVDVENWLRKELINSLMRLKIDSLYGLLLHHPEDLLGPQGDALAHSIKKLKIEGLITHSGISIYTVNNLETYVNAIDVDILQAPFNVMDRRLVDSGWISTLKLRGTMIHTRSVFLQGLLLMSQESLPVQFKPYQPLFNRWYDYLRVEKATALEACLTFPLSFSEIDRIVIGANSLMQLNEILQTTSKAFQISPPDIASQDEGLIDPSRWNIDANKL
jgi:aryl-alcohol dehydrogenase-like predicted oxidoreductase